MRAVVAVALLALAAPAQAGDVFQVPKEQVVARVHVVALAPLRDATDDGIPPAAVARWETALGEELGAVGVKVVPSAEYERVWRTLAAQVGGIWDPISGVVDGEKFKAVRQHTFSELQRLHGIDAVIDWSVVEAHSSRLSSEWNSWGKERWSVGDEPLEIDGAPLVLRIQRERPTRVLVAELWLFLSDRNDVTLYQGALEMAWIEVRYDNRRERRSAERVFAPERDARIRAMVKPLRDAYAAAEADGAAIEAPAR